MYIIYEYTLSLMKVSSALCVLWSNRYMTSYFVGHCTEIHGIVVSILASYWGGHKARRADVLTLVSSVFSVR